MVVVGGNELLAAAVAAALPVLGWQVASTVRGSASAVVLVAGDDGRLPRVPGLVGMPTVAVGGLVALESLAGAVRRGAIAALNADQPFAELMAVLHDALTHSSRNTESARRKQLQRLRRRLEHGQRFTSMTTREIEILGELIAGRSAVEIAGRLRISLATVRTHIRGVLTKLGVSSQIAAVALAHNSCRDEFIIVGMRLIHQF